MIEDDVPYDACRYIDRPETLGEGAAYEIEGVTRGNHVEFATEKRLEVSSVSTPVAGSIATGVVPVTPDAETVAMPKSDGLATAPGEDNRAAHRMPAICHRRNPAVKCAISLPLVWAAPTGKFAVSQQPAAAFRWGAKGAAYDL
jgi:hypothetical protein